MVTKLNDYLYLRSAFHNPLVKMIKPYKTNSRVIKKRNKEISQRHETIDLIISDINSDINYSCPALSSLIITNIFSKVLKGKYVCGKLRVY